MKRCAVCSITDAEGRKLIRFNLIQSIHERDGRHTTRGAGAIVLCEKCWASAARPAMRAVRRRSRAVAAHEAKRRLAAVGVPLEAVA